MKTRKGYKVYPLTSAQKLHFYCLKYCPKKQVLNIGSSLTIQVDLDWDVLKDCIREAIARCYSRGWFLGMAATRFGPDRPMERAMLAAVLHRSRHYHRRADPLRRDLILPLQSSGAGRVYFIQKGSGVCGPRQGGGSSGNSQKNQGHRSAAGSRTGS